MPENVTSPSIYSLATSLTTLVSTLEFNAICGWVEILGCGMVDPHDLEACGIDSNVYTGYAFGMGVERITNLKYRVSDLRLFSENDTRFLREFESAK